MVENECFRKASVKTAAKTLLSVIRDELVTLLARSSACTISEMQYWCVVDRVGASRKQGWIWHRIVSQQDWIRLITAGTTGSSPRLPFCRQFGHGFGLVFWVLLLLDPLVTVTACSFSFLREIKPSLLSKGCSQAVGRDRFDCRPMVSKCKHPAFLML
jgi:hypothetical protein